MADVTNQLAESRVVDDKLRNAFIEACEQGARVHALLTFGFPVCERVPAVKMKSMEPQLKELTLTDSTVFREGFPVGSMENGVAMVNSHIVFVVWYSRSSSDGIDLVGVEMVQGRSTAMDATTQSIAFTYNVVWKETSSERASLFPGWGALSHSEWFSFANTVLLLICVVASLLAWGVRNIRFISEAEEQFTGSIATRHMTLEPVNLPLRFLFYYCAVALNVFCAVIASLVLIATGFSLVRGSGTLYRVFAVVFPLSSAFVAFACGANAIFLAGFIKNRFAVSLQTLSLALAGSAWAVLGAFFAATRLQWGASLLTPLYCVALAALLLLCCVIMWLGAFVTRLLFAAKSQPSILSSHV